MEDHTPPSGATVENEASESALKAPAERRKKERHRAVPLLPELRHFAATGLEIRSQTDTDEIVVRGTAIEFDTPYVVFDLFGEFEEIMANSVADDVLARGVDCRFLFNHGGLPLARTTAVPKTLSLIKTDRGLDIEARLDARQQMANDLGIAIQRQDVSQMSVGFITAKDEWNEDFDRRTVQSFADLLDVSAVTYPCSPTTSIDVATRMALAMPVESRARARKIYADLRAGKVLSQANAEKIASAHEALNTVLLAAGIGQDADPTGAPEAPDSANAGANAQGANAQGANAQGANAQGANAQDTQTVEHDTGAVDPLQGDGSQGDGSQGGGTQGDSGQSPTYTDGSGARMQSSTLRLEAEARRRRRLTVDD